MSLLNTPIYDCENESDVEQKFLFPLLTHPSFLNIAAKSILTKRSMGTLSFVQKSALPKNYVPDYIIFSHGFPVAVIEAKAPNVSVNEAVGEARLYAQVLNQHYPTRINPIRIVIGCNGLQLATAAPDSNECTLFDVDGLVLGAISLTQLQKQCGVTTLTSYGLHANNSVSAATQLVPAKSLNQQLFLDRVKPNALASYLNPLYEMFFRAEDPEKIQLILDKAYVDTAELREYDQVLHSMLRQVERALPNQYRTIRTDKCREYTLTPEIDRYEGNIQSRGRLHLIIGSRGAGKSLFISRFFSYLMPEELKRTAVWCVIDFNHAPSSIDNIEDFICDKFIDTSENLQFDPYSLDGLHQVFSVEINRLERGPLSALSDENQRQQILSNELLKLSRDRRLFALRLGRFLVGEAGRPVIIAFDNVDRRESDQQLKIFQAAQWFRGETRSFALLTLRDVTFETFKGQPPLDAFAQISNFYIRPPRFALVLQKRLKLAIEVGLKDLAFVEQTTDSGLRFRYSKSQLGGFLQSVYDALFSGEQQVGRIVDALAERDVREALGMFARMLASGHFNADRVLGIGTGGSSYINNDLLIKVLMRADYRLYGKDSGFVGNIFSVPAEHFTGNIFINAEILGFFAQNAQPGSDRIGGFWRLDELISDMESMGFTDLEVRQCVQNLIDRKMLAYDGEETDHPDDKDLIKITPGGFIHLRSLPYFVEYISSVALHMPFDDHAVARRIADVWHRAERSPDVNFASKHQVASMCAEYLVRHKAKLDAQNPLFRERSREAESLVRAIMSTVNSTASAANRARTRHSTSNASKRKRKRTGP